MYSNLLNYINSRLPDNITKLITPAKMRQNFAEAIDQLGQDANFMGIVTPSDTIAATEVKQFYVAVPTGSIRTFTNFGGTITVPAYQGCIFFYDNDAWGYQLVNFDAVLQIPDTKTDDGLPIIFQEAPKILNANKTSHVEYSADLTFNPYQKVLTAGFFKGDGSLLENLPLSNYKTKQTAVPDPTAQNAYAEEAITNLSQDANGEITPTKKKVRKDWFGTHQEFDAILVKDPDTNYNIEYNAPDYWFGTQAEFEAIVTYDANTLYFVETA